MGSKREWINSINWSSLKFTFDPNKVKSDKMHAILKSTDLKLKNSRVVLDKDAVADWQSQKAKVVDFGKESNPFNIQIVQRILSHVGDSEVLKFRSVNSTWLKAGTKLIRQRFSMTYGLKLNVPSPNFSQFVKLFNCKLLHDSILLEFDECDKPFENENIVNNSQSVADAYESFVSSFGHLIKSLNLGKVLLDLKVTGFELCKLDTITMFSFLQTNVFERMIFQDFPNLVKLTIIDFVYEENQHGFIFKMKKERAQIYKRNSLPSLKIFNFNVLWGDPEGNCVLSHEIMKISPNLTDIEIKIIENRSSRTHGLLQRLLSSISQFAPTVRNLKFSVGEYFYPCCIRFKNNSLWTRKDFMNLRIDRLTIEENHFHLLDLDTRMDFLRHLTPLGNTVKEFRIISNFNSFKSDDGTDFDFLIPILQGFSKVKILQIQLPFQLEVPNQLFNHIQQQSSNVEELTISFIPTSAYPLHPWLNLKKINFTTARICNEFQSDIADYYNFFRFFAPKLTHLEIDIQKGERKGIILSYPFFVWFGNKMIKLEEFKLTVGELSWAKGSENFNLGIKSITDLTDGDGKFTMSKIKKLDVSQLMCWKDFHSFTENKTGGQYDFFTWLVDNFPKHELFKEFNMRHRRKIYSKSFPNAGRNTLLLLIYQLALQERGVGFEREFGASNGKSSSLSKIQI